MNFKATFLFLFSLIPFAAVSQKNKIDSLEIVLTTAAQTARPSILNQLAELNKRDTSKALTYAREALTLSDNARNFKEQILALKNIGITYGYNNQYDKALDYLLKSQVIAEKNKEWSLAGDNALNIGTIYYVVHSNYQRSLAYYLQALEFFERTNNQKGIASAFSGLGITYTHEKKFDQALETLFKSLSIYKELGEVREIPKIEVNIGTSYKEMKNYDKALEYLFLAVQKFEKTENKRGKAHALYVIGDTYRIFRKYDKALATTKQALALNEESNHKNSITECLIQLGVTYKDMERYNEAEIQLTKAAAVAHEINKPESISIAYQHLASIYETREDYEKAFSYLKLHKAIHDSIFTEKKSQQLAEIQTRFDTETKQKEIIMLKQEKALNQIYLFVTIGMLLSISVIAFLIINSQKLKIKTERALAEKEAQLMEERRTLYEAELRNRELSELSLHGQLDFKNKELASYTLNLIQKNEILEDVKQYVEEIRNTPDTNIRQKLTGLVNMVNYSFHLDKDWENFKLHFEQVHKDFFRKLIEKHPDLSANDLKLCSLIKLNMDNREIAAILNISQESAKVARHRLRKKLDLSAEQTLIAFLATHE
jgi:tetratricopeptide (TPR) repeat protein